MAFLRFSDERIPTAPAGEQPTEKKFMPLGAGIHSAIEYLLNAIKERLADERFVGTSEEFPGSFETNQAHVKGIVQ